MARLGIHRPRRPDPEVAVRAPCPINAGGGQDRISTDWLIRLPEKTELDSDV
jgi:hypothetical protein